MDIKETALLEEEDVHDPNQVETQVTKLFPMYACLLIVLGPAPGSASSLGKPGLLHWREGA